MPAKNVYHDAVVDALKADGWTITHDPLSLKVGDRTLHVDLGAERPPIGAERAGEKIAVEVQSFTGPSPVADCNRRWASSPCIGSSWPTSNRTGYCTWRSRNSHMMGSCPRNSARSC